MALAELVKARANKSGVLIPRIDAYLTLTDMSQDRRDGLFHPSDLSGAFCPRAWSLYNHHPQGYDVKEGGIKPRTHRIFGNGHGVHERIQNYFRGMGVLWGRWRDPVTNDEVWGFPPDEARFNYTEVNIRHEEDGIIGHTDGLLLEEGEKVGLEVKSINDNGFKDAKKAPKFEHVEQAQIYMHCLEWERQLKLALEARGVSQPFKDDFDRLPVVRFVIVYENKNDQDMAEWPVEYDAGKIAAMMEKKRRLMVLAREYERTGAHPDCRCPMGRPNVLCKAFPA